MLELEQTAEDLVAVLGQLGPADELDRLVAGELAEDAVVVAQGRERAVPLIQ